MKSIVSLGVEEPDERLDRVLAQVKAACCGNCRGNGRSRGDRAILVSPRQTIFPPSSAYRVLVHGSSKSQDSNVHVLSTLYRATLLHEGMSPAFNIQSPTVSEDDTPLTLLECASRYFRRQSCEFPNSSTASHRSSIHQSNSPILRLT